MDYVFRVTHWRDMVVHVPNEDFEGYYHHKFEAFYKEKMQPADVTVCQGRLLLRIHLLIIKAIPELLAKSL